MRQSQAFLILQKGRSVFLTGAAGSGKTYLLKNFIKWAQSHNKKLAVTATTGLAATHLNGRTIHSWSGIGIASELSANLLKKIANNKSIVQDITQTDILIIDEISMFSAKHLDMVNVICQRLRYSSEPFGGLQIVLSGDFFQLPPLEKSSSLSNQTNFAIESDVWRSLKPTICYLKQQFRQKNKDDLLEILNALRNHQINNWHIDKLKSRLQANPGNLTELYCHNRDIDLVNQRKLEALPGSTKSFVGEKNNLATNQAVLNNLIKNCLVPEVLELKPQALVMFVSNDLRRKYINGTLGKIVGFDNTRGYPIVDTKQGLKIYTERHTWQVEQDGYPLCTFKQIPLKLAWAMTVHKSQGMTLDGAFIDLGKTFEAGMGYVALSRLTRLENLYLKSFRLKALEINPDVLEIDQGLQRESEYFLKKNF